MSSSILPNFIQNIHKRNKNENPKPRDLIQLKLSVQKSRSIPVTFLKYTDKIDIKTYKHINQMKSKIFYTLSICNLLAFSFYLFSFSSNENAKVVDFQDKIIKVRGIVVVDSLGVERVIIGSHLPEPNLGSYGSRLNSRGKVGVSGVMLYDAEGQERGGYVTDDYLGNAFLSLDSKTNMQLLLLSEPQGAAAIMLNDHDRKNTITLSTSDGNASVKLKKNDKNIKLYENEK